MEPEYYVPSIPMVLINGAEGIATGWSTFIPNYHPLDVMDNLERLIDGQQSLKTLVPWYRGFQGTIQWEPHTFRSGGKVQPVRRSKERAWEITELPVLRWTSTYKAWLDQQQLQGPTPPPPFDQRVLGVPYRVACTVCGALDPSREEGTGGEEYPPEQFFKLISKHSINNMVLFNPQPGSDSTVRISPSDPPRVLPGSTAVLCPPEGVPDSSVGNGTRTSSGSSALCLYGPSGSIARIVPSTG